jgi:hypothetical protein
LWIGLGVFEIVKAGVGTFGGAEVKALGNGLEGEGGFGAEAGSDLEFGRVALEAELEIGLCPTEAFEFFSDDVFGFGCGRLNFEFTGMVVAELAGHFFEHLVFELFAPEIPAAAKGFPLLRIFFGDAAGFHVVLEKFAAGRVVLHSMGGE